MDGMSHDILLYRCIKCANPQCLPRNTADTRLACSCGGELITEDGYNTIERGDFTPCRHCGYVAFTNWELTIHLSHHRVCALYYASRGLTAAIGNRVFIIDTICLADNRPCLQGMDIAGKIRVVKQFPDFDQALEFLDDLWDATDQKQACR